MVFHVQTRQLQQPFTTTLPFTPTQTQAHKRQLFSCHDSRIMTNCNETSRRLQVFLGETARPVDFVRVIDFIRSHVDAIDSDGWKILSEFFLNNITEFRAEHSVLLHKLEDSLDEEFAEKFIMKMDKVSVYVQRELLKLLKEFPIDWIGVTEFVDNHIQYMDTYDFKLISNNVQSVDEAFAERYRHLFEAMRDIDRFSDFKRLANESPIDWNRVTDFVRSQYHDDYNYDTWFHILGELDSLDEEFVEEFREVMDWEIVSQRSDLSLSFIERFESMLDWETLSLNYPLSIDFAELFGENIEWDIVHGNDTIHEAFIIEFEDVWTEDQWDDISEHLRLTEPFIRRMQDRLNWEYISSDQTLSSEFIREFKDKVIWPLVSYFQTIDKPLFLEFKDRIDWVTMSLSGKSEFQLTVTELVDCHCFISQSINRFMANEKKHPLHCPQCAKPVPKHKLKPMKQMCRRISLMHLSADSIQVHWRNAISNPAHKLCRTVLTRDFEELSRNLVSR